MRCLSCHQEDIPTITENCPGCGVYLPGLLRDVLPPGTALNGGLYQLEYALGRGGFGITYRATHTHLEHAVAIKEFYPQEHVVRDGTTGQVTVAPRNQDSFERGVQRFMREGRILVRLNHPHVIRVQNLFKELGTAYLVMEFVSGQTLRQLLDQYKKDGQPIPEAQVQTLLEQMVAALAAVHQAGVFHLDLKPENVLLTPEGQVRLIDFGAARQGFRTTKSQAFTPDYAAPEVLAGREVGPESDIFELGMMLYEMLTGEQAPSAFNRLMPGAPAWEAEDLAEPWRSVVAAALPVAKEERPDDVRHLLEILARAQRKAQSSRLLSGQIRCLHCHQDGLPADTQICPNCRVHLPSLLRDLLDPGTLLHGGVYQLDYALGRGGFGITYRAMNTTLEQPVAIKEFYPQEHAVREGSTGRVSVVSTQKVAFQRAKERFVREGRILARLSHPNVVRVLYLFEEQSTAYLVMELVAGQSLRQVLDSRPEGRLPEAEIRSIMEQVVGALAAVHEAGIYHLDLKPDNVLLTPDGRVVLVDFGAARQGFSSSSTRAFTLAYAPPELLAGGEVGPESDLFELGMMLHELLTGETPEPAMNRLFNDTWLPEGLAEPWFGLVQAALPLAKGERPDSVKAWWALRPAPPPEKAELPSAETEIEPPAGAEPEPAIDLTEPSVEKPDSEATVIEAEPTTATGPICSNCRHKNRPGTKFCERCGASLQEDRVKCWRCSYLNRLGVKFCENCAAALAKPDTACPRCGYTNRPGVRFCENCAAPLAQK